jgi:hypothetical protein
MQILWQVRTSLSELNLDVTIYLIELNSGEVHPVINRAFRNGYVTKKSNFNEVTNLDIRFLELLN